MDKQQAATPDQEYRAAQMALHRLAVIELPADAPGFDDLAGAVETLADVLQSWYTRISASNQPATPQPVRQIGAALFARRLNVAELEAELVQ